MIISHSRKFVFIHVPKTAGTTLSTVLENLTTYKDIEIGSSELGSAYQIAYRKKFGIHKHSTAAQVKKLMGDEDFYRYFSFAFVRNPFDRLSSLYRFLKNWKGLPPIRVKQFENYISFQDFLDDGLWLEDGWLFDEQTKWISDFTVSKKPIISFVGRVEYFNRDLRDVMGKIAPDFQVNVNIKKNISPKMRDFQWKISDINRVIERYQSDFINFDYPQDPKKILST